MTATLHPRRVAAPMTNRIVAALIDRAIVGLPSLAALLLTSERFRLLEPSSVQGRLSETDQARVDQIASGFHRAVEIDGWLHTIDAAGIMVTIGVVSVAALVATVAFPLLSRGRTPGMHIANLQVVGRGGRAASAGQHLVRTLAGPIDLLFLPLLGFLRFSGATAGRDLRRLGDRLAETWVTDVDHAWVVTPAGLVAGHEHPVDLAVIGLDPWSAGPSEGDLDRSAPATIILTEPAAVEEPQQLPVDQPVVLPATETGDVDRPAPPLRPIRRQDGSPTRSPRSRRGATRADVEHRWPDSAAADQAATGQGTNGISAPRAETPEPGRPETIWLGHSADYADWSLPDLGEQSGPGRPGPRPTRRTRPQAYDTLLFPESSLAPGSSMVMPTGPKPADGGSQPSHGQSPPAVPGGGAGLNGDQQPMWDRDRQAWAYRDRSTGRWFRHDPATDGWQPIATED